MTLSAQYIQEGVGIEGERQSRWRLGCVPEFQIEGIGGLRPCLDGSNALGAGIPEARASGL